MCGFVTIIKKNNFKKFTLCINDLKKINKHRGPDKIKTLHEKNYSILFRRLSIIDTSVKAHQPFESHDKKIKLVFNGEIYNFIELRNKLIKKNYIFSTSSDTEVILKCYQEYGINFIKKIRGMFSIVLFDKTLDKIFFIRDRLGQKPLFYTFVNKNLIVSSEIKDILFIFKKLKIKFKENKTVVHKYLLRGWANDNNDSFFKNIFQFPAGTYSVYNNNKLSDPISYWTLNLNGKRKFNIKLFKKKFEENIKIHLRSDIPIAFTLSGGMDSGSIVKISENFKKNIKAFSLISSYNDESITIDKLIKKSDIKHEYIKTEKLYKKDSLKNLIKYQDEPLISASHFDQYLMRKKIKSKGYKVLLVGEGGDEVLGGYLRLVIIYLCELYIKKKINFNNKIFVNLKKYYNYNEYKLKDKIRDFINKKKKKNDIEDLTSLFFLKKKIKLNKDLKYKNPFFCYEKNLFKKSLSQQIFKADLPHILRAEDRISMANNIENRSPFLDHKFIEYVFSHKSKYFVKDGIPKYMLRKAMINTLPKEFINNKKIARPQSPSLILRFYSQQFKSLLRKYNISNFDKTKIRKQFIFDYKKKEFNERSNFYFRVFNYLLWKDINFNN